MTCNAPRPYLKTEKLKTTLPSVPTSPNDWTNIRNLLQSMRDEIMAQAVIPPPAVQSTAAGAPETGVLPAPTGLAIDGDGPISLSWNPYPDSYLEAFAFFKVYRSVANNFQTSGFAGTAAGTRFVDSDITVATTYYYWVTGVTKLGLESGPAGPVSAAFSGFGTGSIADNSVTTDKLVNLAVTAAKVAALAITETKIADDAISTPKIQAGAITAAKIDVGQLSAISADIGTITAGTITGAVLQTATSNARVVLDSTNGFQAYDASNNLKTQIAVSGGVLGSIKTNGIVNIETSTDFQITYVNSDISSIALAEDRFTVTIDVAGAAPVMVFDAAGLFVEGALDLVGQSVIVDPGQGIYNTGDDGIALATGAVEFYTGGVLRGKFDETSHATNTNFYLYHNGSLKQVTVDGSGFLKV